MLMGYINGLVVLQIVAHPHRLLVTLVLCNASATEALLGMSSLASRPGQ